MPELPIQFAFGKVESTDPFEVADPRYAAAANNFMHTAQGSLLDRPGLTEFATIGSFPVVGLAFFNSLLFAVTSDRRMYQVSSAGVVTDVTGTVLEGSGRPQFDTDGDELVIAGGGEPRSWTGSGNTSALAGSPEDCTRVVYLDGYWIMFLPGQQELRWAGPTNTARQSWSSAKFFQAESLPDDIVGIAVNQRELFAFGSTSTEVFQNYGDSSVPFRRVFSLSDNGLSAECSIVRQDNTLWYLDSNRRFVQLQGRTPVSVSSPFLDRELAGLSTVSDCWGWTANVEGQFLIGWTFPTVERTFVYDYRAKDWSEWDGYVDGQSDRWRGHSHCYAPEWNKHFIGDYRTGTIWQLTRTAKQDGDVHRRLLRRTGRIDHGTAKRKRSNYYLLDVKRGVGTAGSTEPVIEMRVNDDGKGWTNPVQVGLGYPGDEQKPIRVSGLRGVYRNRQLEIQATDAVEVVIRQLTEDVEVMAS